MFGFIVFYAAISVAALFIVFGTFASSSPLQQALMATALGVLSVLAVALIYGSLRLETRTELRSLAAHYELDETGSVLDLRRRILLHLWRKQGSEAQFDPVKITGGRDLGEDLAAPPPSLWPSPLEVFNRENPQQLVKEGEYLLGIAKLLKVDAKPYGRILARAHRVAQEGSYEEWIKVMQAGNERLRARLEETVSEES